jgi:hypothetical protein
MTFHTNFRDQAVLLPLLVFSTTGERLHPVIQDVHDSDSMALVSVGISQG